MTTSLGHEFLLKNFSFIILNPEKIFQIGIVYVWNICLEVSNIYITVICMCVCVNINDKLCNYDEHRKLSSLIELPKHKWPVNIQYH